MICETVVGIDLAGKEKNPTGFCILKDKNVKTCILYKNDEITEKCDEISPKVIAIDAPLTLIKSRICDRICKKYGAMPLSMKGIQMLAVRGVGLSEVLKIKGYEVIEVFPTGTAKVLGMYSKDRKYIKEEIVKRRYYGDVKKEISRDEVDAILSAITACMYLNGMTIPVGDDDGVINLPSEEGVRKWNEMLTERSSD